MRDMFANDRELRDLTLDAEKQRRRLELEQIGVAREKTRQDAADMLRDIKVQEEVNAAAPAPAPLAATAWAPLKPGSRVMTRINPAQGRREFFENVPEKGTVSSWSESYTPPPVDSGNKSFAQILITDIPSRLNLMQQKLAKGDIVGAEKLRDSVLKFTDDNSDVLNRLTGFRGTDPVTRRAAEQAMSLVSQSFLDEKTSAMFDPRLNPESVKFDAIALGLDASGRKYLAQARYGDGAAAAEAAAVAGYLHDGRAVSQPAEKATKQSIEANDRIDDPSTFNTWARYYDSNRSKVMSTIPETVLQQLAPDAIVGTMRKTFEAGDQAAGGALAGLAMSAVGEAADASDLEKANLWKSATDVIGSGMKAWGAGDDMQVAQGARVLSAIKALAPGRTFAANRQTIISVMGQASVAAKAAASAGVQMPQDKLDSVARVLYMRAANPTQALTGDDAATAKTLADVKTLSDRVVAPVAPYEPVPAQGKDQPPAETVVASGYGSLLQSMQSEVSAAGMQALANGTQIKDELETRKASISDRLLAAGAGSREDANNAAALVVMALGSGQEVDLRKLPELVRKFAGVKEFEYQGLDKIALMPQTAVAKTMNEARLRVFDAKRAGDMALLSAVTRAEENPAFGPGALTAGAARRNLGEVFSSIAKTVAAPDRDRSRAFSMLLQTPMQDLESPKTQKAAADAFVAQFKTENPVVAAGLPGGALEKIAEDYVASTAAGLRSLDPTATTLLAGDRLGAASFVPPAETAVLPAGGAYPVAPRPGTGDPARVAQRLTEAYLTGLDPEKPGFISRLRQKAILTSNATPVAAEATGPRLAGANGQPVSPQEVAPKVDLTKLAGVDVKAGLAGLEAVRRKADRPIHDAMSRQLILEDLPGLLKRMVAQGSLPETAAIDLQARAEDFAASGEEARSIMAKVNQGLNRLVPAYAAQQAAIGLNTYRTKLILKQQYSADSGVTPATTDETSP